MKNKTFEKNNSGISVILNLYKRPENLLLQLEALKKQSLKPKEILLYQDGTGDAIKIPENIKNDFDIIEINPENKGVWARFDFARRKAGCKYVCVFDDDTIPGSRWLENCYTEMMKQKGLYGTIGIIMKNPSDYPYKCGISYFRTGWDGNLNQTVEVDFVGHSWFFKKEWLDDLFNAPAEIQKCKFAGEDMAFSYQLLKRGIKTFVPPHPKDNQELFGSIPKSALELGTNKSAVSLNQNNLNTMTACIKILLDSGWETLIKRNPKYVRKIEQKLNNYKNILFGLITKQKTNSHKIITIFGIKIKLKIKCS